MSLRSGHGNVSVDSKGSAEVKYEGSNEVLPIERHSKRGRLSIISIELPFWSLAVECIDERWVTGGCEGEPKELSIGDLHF